MDTENVNEKIHKCRFCDVYLGIDVSELHNGQIYDIKCPRCQGVNSYVHVDMTHPIGE